MIRRSSRQWCGVKQHLATHLDRDGGVIHEETTAQAEYLSVEDLRQRLSASLPDVSSLSRNDTVHLLATFERPLPPEVHGLTDAKLRKRLKDHLPAPAKLPRTGLVAECLRRGLISPAEASATRKRPDISSKRKAAFNADELCRTMALSSLLKGIDRREQLQQRIDGTVETLSQVMHQRSFVVLLHLRRLIAEGRPLPDLTDSNATFFRHCFTVGIGTTRDADVKATLDAYHDCLWRLPELPSGLNNAVSHAAKLYKTNFVNHFTLLEGMLRRIKKLVSYRLHGIEPADEGQEASGGGVTSVVQAIVDDAVLLDDLERWQHVVDDVRARLGLLQGAQLTEAWLKANIDRSVHFVLHLCRHFDDVKTEARRILDSGGRVRKGAMRGLKFCPTHRCAPHSVKLDASDLVRLFQGVGAVPDAVAAVETPLEIVRSVLGANLASKFPGLADHFSGTIDTDGTSVSVHFRRPLPDGQLRAKKERIERAIRAREERKLGKAQGVKAPTKAAAVRRPMPRVLLSVDVGRVNLLHVAVLVDGKPLYVARPTGQPRRLAFQMTAAHFYTASGIRLRRRVMLRRRRRQGLEKLDGQLSKTTLRSGDVSDVLEYLRTFKAAQDIAWRAALHAATRQDKLRARAGRARTMDRFYSGIKRRLRALVPYLKATDIAVAWGSAKVSPSGRGNVPVPTGAAYKAACLRFRKAVHPTDEYRSSRSCPKANCRHCDVHAVRVVADEGCSVKLLYPVASMAANIRRGFVALGTRSTRMAHRMDKCHDAYSTHLRALKVSVAVRHRIDGHAGEPDDVKRAKKRYNTTARNLRGLLFCQECKKYMDRDAVGAENIGTIWTCDNVLHGRPDAFDREAQARIRPPRVKKCPAVKPVGRRRP